MIRFKRTQIGLLLAPYVLGVVLLIVLPAGLSMLMAFTRYNGLSTPQFIGWENFITLFRDPVFKVTLLNSLIFIFRSVQLRLLGALLLALFYNHPRRAIGFHRAAIYLPTVIPDAAYALAWVWILNPVYGPLNVVLRTLGLPAPAWLADPAWAMPALILASLFQIGEGFIILLAGLHHIPQAIHDAARVDGANSWQRFIHITFPLLTPWLVLLTIRDIVLMFQNTFTPAYLMTRGGPYYATFFLPQLTYETAFDGFRFGQAAAIMLIIFLFTLALTLLVYFIFEGWGLDEE